MHLWAEDYTITNRYYSQVLIQGTSLVAVTVLVITPSQVQENKKGFATLCSDHCMTTSTKKVWTIYVVKSMQFYIPLQVQSVSNSTECAVYEGQTCKEALLGVQNCLPDRIGSDDVYIPFDRDQEEIENQAALIIERGLNAIGASPECKERAIPFLCVYYFGLCDSSGVEYQSSIEECTSVSTGICEAEWITANLFLPGQLPLCESLQEGSTHCGG